MKRTTTEHFCDRCNQPVIRECAMIIENVSMAISGYDPRGSGGTTRNGLEFCSSCSGQLFDWLNMKEPRQ